MFKDEAGQWCKRIGGTRLFFSEKTAMIFSSNHVLGKVWLIAVTDFVATQLLTTNFLGLFLQEASGASSCIQREVLMCFFSQWMQVRKKCTPLGLQERKSGLTHYRLIWSSCETLSERNSWVMSYGLQSERSFRIERIGHHSCFRRSRLDSVSRRKENAE